MLPMICIIKRNPALEITGWIIAADYHDARRQAEAAVEHALAAVLYRLEFPPREKCDLPVPGPFRYTLLPTQ